MISLSTISIIYKHLHNHFKLSLHQEFKVLEILRIQIRSRMKAFRKYNQKLPIIWMTLKSVNWFIKMNKLIYIIKNKALSVEKIKGICRMMLLKVCKINSYTYQWILITLEVMHWVILESFLLAKVNKVTLKLKEIMLDHLSQ